MFWNLSATIFFGSLFFVSFLEEVLQLFFHSIIKNYNERKRYEIELAYDTRVAEERRITAEATQNAIQLLLLDVDEAKDFDKRLRVEIRKAEAEKKKVRFNDLSLEEEDQDQIQGRKKKR